MDKPTKKRQNYNTEAVKVLAKEFGVTVQYVRQCIRKEKYSLTADAIRKKYYELADPSSKAINDFRTDH
ncbi:hypothetical protein CMU93_09770 [Elizabethkingia anophelis]|uniref:hypothetical protein n=1 Tax=Elizabethkingia anophelis TaxID=1117645 RepID=UPI00137168A6|nr:hypothetical protein [Elizabethkingia anophelis]MDV2447784.1 hypothetical protein [Elizabethkingia anophelis]MYZ58672.1 hypothetical protein [Elizabethkingia anophelis]